MLVLTGARQTGKTALLRRLFPEHHRRQIEATGSRAALHVWRDRSREVDLLVHRGGRFWLADVKWSEQPDPRACQPLLKVRELLPEGSVAGCALLCRAANPWPLGEVEVVPAVEAASWLGVA